MPELSASVPEPSQLPVEPAAATPADSPVVPAVTPATLHIQDLAVTLFDCTQSLHGLRPSDRRLLQAAARLHSLPLPQGKKKRLQAARRALVELPAELRAEELRAESPTQGFTPGENDLLAALLAYSPEGARPGALSKYGLALTAEQKQEFLALWVLARLAAALDASGSQGTRICRVESEAGALRLVLDGPQADIDAQAARDQAGWWEQAGYLPLQIVSAAQAPESAQPHDAEAAPAEPQPRLGPGILPNDSLAEAGRKVWRYQLAEMLRNEEGTRLGEDVEALHDMRVATRRMRAAFEVFGQAFAPEELKRHLKGLRATGRALGSVRDLDVFMEKAHHYLESLPEAERSSLDPLLQAWALQREQARATMLEHLNSEAYARFVRRFQAFLEAPEAEPPAAVPAAGQAPTPLRVCEIAPVLIYTRLAAVRAYEAILASATEPQLHMLRIEFKKLRYTVEYFQEVLGPESKAVIGEMKRMQDHLGDLNDAVVATQILSDFLKNWDVHQVGLPITERRSAEGVVSYLAARHAERHLLLTTFGEAWARWMRPEFRKNLSLAVSVL